MRAQRYEHKIELKFAPGFSIPDQEKYLDEMSQLGWELITITKHSTITDDMSLKKVNNLNHYWLHFYFRKPLN